MPFCSRRLGQTRLYYLLMRFRAVIAAGALLSLAPGEVNQSPCCLPGECAPISSFCARRNCTAAFPFSPGANVAAQFIAAEFQHAGLKPAFGDSFFQAFGLVEPRLDAEKVCCTVAQRAAMSRSSAPARTFEALSGWTSASTLRSFSPDTDNCSGVRV